MAKVNMTGSLVDESEAKISVFDHGLLYGDGVFEGIRVYNKTIFKLEDHLERLYASAKSIKLKMPIGKETFKKEVIRTCKENNIASGYIRAIVTRGIGDLGLNPYICSGQSYIIIAKEVDPLLGEKSIGQGVDVITSSVRRVSNCALNIRAKTLNYLNSVLALAQAIDLGRQEAIMFGEHGYATEGSADNLFIVTKDTVKTPASHLGILEGITRNTVIEICKDIGYSIEEASISMYDILTADELFLTGTLAEIVPVRSIDGRIVGDGKPGKITKTIAEQYKKVTQKEGAHY
ncbi:MAG: branched-chain-amino-acid transaminase [archaeon]